MRNPLVLYGGIGKDTRFRLPSQFLKVALFCLFCSLCPPEFTWGQGAGINEQFRQATEAMRAGRLDAAAEGFSSIIIASPSFAEAHLNLGLVREEQGRNEQAIASFQKALTLKPRLRGANLFLGVAEYRLNELAQAVAALRKETSYYPTDANAWMWLGVAELAADHPEDAVNALDKAVKLAPDNVDILYHRGRAHLLVSKASYERMFHADPNSWRVHQVLAQADSESDRVLDAIAEYQAAIKLAPQQPGLHEELAGAYSKAGKPDLAEVELRRELEIDPHSAIALYKLGTLQVEGGKAAEGKTAIEAALQLRPGLKDAAYYLGRAEMHLGNNEAAVEQLKQAVASDAEPEIIEQAWYQLSVVYRRMRRADDSQRALAMFQKLKDEAAEHQQQGLEKKRAAQGLESAPPADPPKDPNKH
jgi:tetratricopeptide (TPR) repeat protein